MYWGFTVTLGLKALTLVASVSWTCVGAQPLKTRPL